MSILTSHVIRAMAVLLVMNTVSDADVGLPGEKITGTYSNLCYTDANRELSGIEITILLGGDGYWVVVQIAAGVPSNPTVTQAYVEDSLIEFTADGSGDLVGTFQGYVSGDSLHGKFIKSTESFSLKRQPSYWQRHAVQSRCRDSLATPDWRPYKSLYIPAEGFIPDSITAVSMAEAVFLPIYGREVLLEKPFRAVLHGDSIWTVEGAFASGKLAGHKGGSAFIEFRKADGRILGINHGE